jgi:hypothetical protein
MRRALAWLCLFGLAPSSCALVGYDFGDYQRAPASAAAGAANEQPPTSDGGATQDDRAVDHDQGSAGLADGPAISGSAGDAAEHPIGPEPTTFSAGGAPSETSFASGGATPEGGAASDGCVPQTCEGLPAACGSRDDGCGHELDCGSCFWWFLECRENVCEFKE